MKGRISNPQGDVMIRTDVIAKYAGSMAVECFGIVGMASVSMKDGLVHLLKKDSITKLLPIPPYGILFECRQYHYIRN